MKYTLDIKKWKPEAYMESMMKQIPFICRDIVKLPMPIDLYTAHVEYHYVIFSNNNSIFKKSDEYLQFLDIMNIRRIKKRLRQGLSRRSLAVNN